MKHPIISFIKSYGLIIVVLSYVIINQRKVIINNFSAEGQTISPIKVTDYQSEQTTFFPNPNENYVVIFWATWCTPCKIEMKRLKASVENNKIPKTNLIAINAFEDSAIIKKFLTKEPYPFTFVNDHSSLSRLLKVRGTPTIALIEKGKLISLSTGMSFIGIFRAEMLFK